MASKVDFGLWYDFRNPEPWQIDFEQLYHERLDQKLQLPNSIPVL